MEIKIKKKKLLQHLTCITAKGSTHKKEINSLIKLGITPFLLACVHLGYPVFFFLKKATLK